MPFTVTHVLATLPVSYVRSAPGLLTAMAVGSMIPDWPLFVPFGPEYATTHTLPGVFRACLPLGLAVTVAFLALMKRPLYELLPDGLRRRLGRFMDAPRLADAATQVRLAAGVVFGAITHIVWDAFTHGNGWGVALYPDLRSVWVEVADVRFTGYMALQHGSSLVGLPLIAILFAAWYRRAPADISPARRLSSAARSIWLLLILGVPLTILVDYLLGVEGGGLRPVIRALYFGVTEGGFAFLALVSGYTLVFYPLVQALRRLAARGT